MNRVGSELCIIPITVMRESCPNPGLRVGKDDAGFYTVRVRGGRMRMDDCMDIV
jgi:hypothetical protein